MDMERSAGPRIYVPINMPDHPSQPTYAVLEFVGFSSPAPADPLLLHSPAPVALPSPAPSIAAPMASFYPLPAAPPPRHAVPALPASHFAADFSAFLVPSPSHLLPQYAPARPYPCGSRLEVVNLHSPPSSPSSVAPSSASSASRESSREKHSAQIPPMSAAKPVVCFAPSVSDSSSALVNGLSSRPAANFSSSLHGPHPSAASMPRSNFSQITERDVMQTKISVSQTDRETIVHTHSANFRDVVRQLTGASSDDRDLLPVTLPARLANRVNGMQNQNQNQNNTGAEVGASGAGAGGGPVGCSAAANGGGPPNRDQLGLRKAPLKLHERRKSTMKNLEKVTSAFSLYGAAEVSPIMNASPVTPLVSDFERCCNASTPTSQGSSRLSSPIATVGKGAGEAGVGRGGEQSQQQESGCFFSLQCPPAGARPASSVAEKPSPPTLLSLFPESPSCSPHDH